MCAYFLGDSSMDEVFPGVFIGGVEAEMVSLQNLQLAGITHVVQLASGFISPTHPDSLTYLCVRAIDHEGEDLLSKLKESKVLEFIDGARSSGGQVLVHCQAGVSRSATVVISYLMTREQMTFEDALVRVLSKRGIVKPNRGFCDQLRILQNECHNDLAEYTPDMLKNYGKDLTEKQHLALLCRAQNKVGLADGTDAALQAIRAADFSGFKERLEMRKRVAKQHPSLQGDACPTLQSCADTERPT